MPDSTDSEGSLSDAKRELLHRLSKGDTGKEDAPDVTSRSIPRCEEDPAPLTTAQERMWVVQQLDPASPVYNMPMGLRLRGPLQEDVLRRSLGDVVERQAALRTRIVTVAGTPRQTVDAAVSCPLPVIDLSGCSDVASETATVLRRIARDPFDLEDGPLFRVFLIRQAVNEHVLVFNVHHIVFDAWSAHVFAQSVMRAYKARRQTQGGAVTVPNPSIRPGDYAAWQREKLDGEWHDRHQDYVDAAFPTPPPALNLPTDHEPPAVPTQDGDVVEFEVSRSVRDRVAALAREEGATLFMTLLATFQILLARYSHQDDFAVGTPVANRDRTETKSLIGLLINTLVLRADLSGAPSARQVIRRVRKTTVRAFEHKELPFEDLVETVQPSRSMRETPLFQVLFALQNIPRTDVQMPELDVERVRVDSDTSEFTLSLYLFDEADREDSDAGLSARLEYRTDLFERSTMRAMGRAFTHLLHAVAADPDQSAARLPLFSGESRRRLLDRGRSDGAPFDARRIDRMIADRARCHPDAPALLTGWGPPNGRQWRYRDLEARANRLARHLRARGVKPGDRVGLLVERSPELVASLLAIWKAGAAYVPLDPAYPAERLRYILQDSGAAALVTTETAREGVAAAVKRYAQAGRAVIDLTEEAEAIAARPSTGAGPLGREASPTGTSGEAGRRQQEAGSLAYVIYTSGSTGKPKGVEVTHGNVSNFFAGMDARVPGGIPPEEMGEAGEESEDERPVWLSVTTVSFDISVLELAWTLARGFTVAMHVDPTGRVDDAERAGDASRFPTIPEQIRAHDATHLQCTPSQMQMLQASREGANAVQALDHVLLGGETLPVPLARDLLMHGENAHAEPSAAEEKARGSSTANRKQVGDSASSSPALYNMYGPTEATIWATSERVERPLEASVPIGRPLANTQVYVLNEHMEPVPEGVWGELYVGGANVVRGYSARPRATARAFVPDPYGGEAGARLYRTGDRVRWRADGGLAFGGRFDHQVKVRGHRIELGEVEAHLVRAPGVERAAASVHKRGKGRHAQLVGYVVREAASGEAETDWRDAVRTHVSSRAPDALVPDVVVDVDTFPTTPNGKIDRAALPAPDTRAAVRADAYVPPSTDTERRIARIWKDVLDLDRVGRHDNFFDIGGDSVRAIQIITAFQNRGYDVSPNLLFQSQTVAHLADHIEDLAEGHAEEEPLPVQPLVCSTLEGHPHAKATWFSVDEAVTQDSLRAALAALVRHHRGLRLRLDGATTSRIAAPDGVDVPVRKVPADVDESEANAAVQAATHAVVSMLDAASGPVLGAVLVRHPTAPRLHLAVHGVAVDAAAWRMLARDLNHLLKQATSGEPLQIDRRDGYGKWIAHLEERDEADADAEGRAPEPLGAEPLSAEPLGAEPLGAEPLGADDEKVLGALGPSSEFAEKTHVLTGSLDEAATSRLRGAVHDAYRMDVAEIVVAALARAVFGLTSASSLRLNRAHDLRPTLVEKGLSVQRVVGNLTRIHPLRLTRSDAGSDTATQDLHGHLSHVKQQLRGVALFPRARLPDPRSPATPPIGVEHVSQPMDVPDADAVIRPESGIATPFGSPVSPVELTTWLDGNTLQARWRGDAAAVSRSGVQALADAFQDALAAISEVDASEETGTVSADDFPLADLGDDLDTIADQLS